MGYEEHTKADRKLWILFWTSKADEGGRLRTRPGKWLHAIHRQREWFKDSSTGQVFCQHIEMAMFEEWWIRQINLG